MRSFVIAAVMTALVAGLGYAIAPAPRVLGAAPDRAVPVGEDPALVSPGEALAREEARPEAESAAPPSSTKHTFYQWTDPRGTVRFARSLEEVPPEWRGRAGQVEVDTAAYAPRPARTAAGGSRPRPYADFATPRAEARFADVTVYTAPWCGWCRKTLAWLDEHDVTYTNKDIEANADYAAELEEKSGGRSIPFVEIDGTQIRGFSPGEMAALLLE